MIQRLKDCWLVLIGKGTIRSYDDDPWVPDKIDLEAFAEMWEARRLRFDGKFSEVPASRSNLPCDRCACQCQKYEPDLSDQTIEEIAEGINGETWTR